MTIKTRQVLGVTVLVGLVVAVLSAVHLATLARKSLEETESRCVLLANAVFARAREVVPGASDPYDALRRDPGLRSILESSIAYSRNVTYAALVDPNGVAIAHSFRALDGRKLEPQGNLRDVTTAPTFGQMRGVYSDQIYEVRQQLRFGDRDFGSIRVGVSTLLVRAELHQALRQASQTALGLMLLAMLVATLLSQWLLRPIHVIRAGLSRLGRGEANVRLDLPEGEEFKELGTSFQQVSAQLAEMRARQPGHSEIETVVERLEDAVALVNANGEVLFANPAMRALLPELQQQRAIDESLPKGHVARELLDQTLISRRPHGPITAKVEPPPGAGRVEGPIDLLLATSPIEDAERGFTGAMLVVRDLGYLDQVRSTLQYSRKLAAIGRLLAGVAHEVKNPLNAMTIHLELLKNKLAPADVGGFGAAAQSAAASGTTTADVVAAPAAMKHVDIIAAEIRRLDQVMQDFLKFARPGEARLEPIELSGLLEDIARIIGPDAERAGVSVKVECAPHTPEINGDHGMLRQALMNLAINAYQAMPNGGTIKMGCRPFSSGRVEVIVEDNGQGIKPEHLDRIFDLYFTTKEKGSGIGLSMVYQIVQLHDGEIEVQSTPGAGTRFRIMLPGIYT